MKQSRQDRKNEGVSKCVQEYSSVLLFLLLRDGVPPSFHHVHLVGVVPNRTAPEITDYDDTPTKVERK